MLQMPIWSGDCQAADCADQVQAEGTLLRGGRTEDAGLVSNAAAVTCGAVRHPICAGLRCCCLLTSAYTSARSVAIPREGSRPAALEGSPPWQ